MLRFTLQRLMESLAVLAAVAFLSYGLMGLMPGDPIDLMINANPELTPADAARLKAIYGLDQPILTRFWAWAGDLMSGDFGYSRIYGQPVVEVLWPRLSNTLALMVPALLLSLGLAIPLGMIAALRPYSWLDYGVNLFSFAGLSVPSFWLSLLAIVIFAVTLGWLPASGADDGSGGLLKQLHHMILPVAVLTISNIGSYIRFMRAATIGVLRQDYIRTARAKGLSQSQLLRAHVLRNALLPLVTVVALSLGSLFSGTLIVETIFAWPGMGKTIFDSVLGNDYNLAMIGFLLATFTTLLGNLAADLCHAALDPRVSLTNSAEAG